MKLFVSLPMHDRYEEDIREEMEGIRNLIEQEFETEVELIDSVRHGEPPADILHRNWYLGQSISKLAQANVVAFAPEWRNAHGCIIERMVCDFYNIPFIDINLDENYIPDEKITDKLDNEVIYDYTHDPIDQTPIIGDEIDKSGLSHEDSDDYDISVEDDVDELEDGEYDADDPELA